jgi:hypothetical protein
MKQFKLIRSQISCTRAGQRSATGASLALVAAFSGVLILCILAAYGLANLFGASEEARNGVDAGALNLANKSVAVKTPAQGVFTDCADTSGGIGLTNINRVWGKALIVNANVQSMQNSGQAGGLAQANAQSAFSGAQSINDALFQALTDSVTTSGLFNNMAARRGAKMLSGSKTLVASTKNSWPIAALNRGGASNLTMKTNQIPANANIAITPVGGVYAPGYQPIQVDNKPFYFVAFPVGERPHLVSGSVFQLNRIDAAPVGGVKNPIPNGFSASGSVEGAQAGVASNAFAVANPQRQYQLSIPHAYISIQLTNTAQWMVGGKKLSETQYGLVPETQWGVKMYQLKNKAMLNGYASLGNEYAENKVTKLTPSLWNVLTSLPGDYNVVLQQMTQRLQEISPAFSQAQLENLLIKQRIVPNATRYLIYPTFANKDETNPTFQITAVNGAAQLPAWLAAVYVADGTEKPLVTEGAQRDVPNFDWQTVEGGQGGAHYADLTGTLNWEPDSGYNQCLGQLRIAHTTECFFAVGQ